MTVSRVPVANVDDVEPGTLHACTAGAQRICLVRTSDGAFYALDDRCSHEHVDLSDGDLVDDLVECPLHGSRFDPATGEARELPAWEPVPTFSVIVDGAQVLVEIDER